MYNEKYEMKNVKLEMCLARSFSCQLHTASCSLNLGARGTTFAKEEDRMKKTTRQIMTVILLFTFLLGAGIGPALAQQQVKVKTKLQLISFALTISLCTLWVRLGCSQVQAVQFIHL